jgi:hypothetical protein
MDRPRTSFRLLVALCASVVFAAACSSGGDQEVGLKGVTTSPSSTATTGTTAADAADSDLTAVLAEAIDKTRSAETMDVTLELAFDGGKVLDKQQVTIAGELATDGTRASLSSSADGVGAMEVRILDDKAWVGGDMEQVRQALPKGAEWAELATKDLVASPGFGDVGELSFIYLLGGATNVEATGDDEYTFDLDVAKAASSAPADLRDEVSGLLSFSGENEPEITGTVELDDEGRVASMTIHGVQKPSPAEAEQFGEDAVIKLSLNVEIDDFGEPVEVEAPAGDTVVPIAEAPELAKLLGLGAEPGIEG